MPAFLVKGQTYDGATPLLEFFASRNGILTDLYSLEYEIWRVDDREEASQVGTGRTVVNVGTVYPAAGAGKLSAGRYFATWAVPATEELGAHEIRWFYKFASGDVERRAVVPFEVVTHALEPRGLCMVTELRSEGVPQAIDDDRCLMSIALATQVIERLTGRYFEPRYLALTLDGTGTRVLSLDDPIVGIESVKIAYDGNFTAAPALDSNAYRVYARHIDGMIYPDDRSTPRIEISLDPLLLPTMEFGAAWYPGSRNLEVRGAFGFTAPDGTPMGKTPDLIRRACKKLALRYMDKLAPSNSDVSVSAAASASSGVGGPIIRKRTRDQEIEYAAPGTPKMISSGLTGDVAIDTIIEMFRRPARIRAV